MSEFSEHSSNFDEEADKRIEQTLGEIADSVLSRMEPEAREKAKQQIFGVEAVKVEVDEPPAAGARTEQQIVADIQAFQLMGDAACLTDEIRPTANALLTEWLDLPLDDDDEDAPMPAVITWLWDLLDSGGTFIGPAEPPADVVVSQTECDEPEELEPYLPAPVD